MLIRRPIWAPLLAALAAGAVFAGPLPAPSGIEAYVLRGVAVPLNPADPGQTTAGRLRFMGALVLRSDNPRFGGLSGLRAGADGRFLSVSDIGNWVTFTTIERRGWLTGVRGGVIAPILDRDGKPPAGKAAGDAEAVDWPNDAEGSAVVSFEQDHRLQAYRFIDPATPLAFTNAAVNVLRFAAAADWPENRGGEALANLDRLSLVLISEGGAGPAGGRDALWLTETGKLRFSYLPPDGFDPTDAIELASPTTLLVLNRRFSFGQLAASLTVITLDPAERDKPGERVSTAPVAGREIARLASPLTVDNMEGVALRREGDRTFVYLVSDDNFNPLQRTLLMKFELLP